MKSSGLFFRLFLNTFNVLPLPKGHGPVAPPLVPAPAHGINAEMLSEGNTAAPKKGLLSSSVHDFSLRLWKPRASGVRMEVKIPPTPSRKA